MKSAMQSLSKIIDKIAKVREEKNNLDSSFSQKKDRKLHLEAEISKLMGCIAVENNSVKASEDNYNDDIAIAQEIVKKTETRLIELKKENEVMSCGLEAAKRDYITKMEEKSNKLVMKLEAEKILHSEEILMTNIKLIEDQIAQQKTKHEELSEKMINLTSDQSLQDLNKKKAYLMASTDYLTEKLTNMKKDLENNKAELKDLQQDLDYCKKCNQLYQGKIDDLNKEIQEQKDNFNIQESEETQKSVTPTGILKSPSSHKKGITSPKRVKFEAFSSYESSSTGDAVNLSQSSQHSIMGKSFDDIMAEIQAETFKKPQKTQKKRKLDFE